MVKAQKVITGMSDAFARLPFGGHEKFVFRQGWLKKGVDAALRDPLVFSREDAFVTLGVGKNMVTSIRYWGLALGLLIPFSGESGSVRAVQPSLLGRNLLADGGWDPYLEDIGSLWLLHWLLAGNQERGLVWYLVFSRYFDVEFRKPQIVEFIWKQLTQMGIETTENMVVREVDVFLRTYIPAQSRSDGVHPKQKNWEESLDCPLVDLNLLRLAPGDGVYRFDIGAKPSLPAAVFGYALFNFLSEKTIRQRTVTVDECVYKPGSPGQIFKLDENSVMTYLEQLESLTNGALRLQETAGLRQIYLHTISPEQGQELLRGYYG